MATYNPKRKTENGMEEVKLPLSAIVGSENLQVKQDEALETADKTIVGAINEVNAKAGDSTVGTWVFNDEITSVLDVIDTQEKLDEWHDGGYAHSLKGYVSRDGERFDFEKLRCVLLNGTFIEWEEEVTYENEIYLYEYDYDLFYYDDGEWGTPRTITITEEPSTEVGAWIRANAKKKEITPQINVTYKELRALRDSSSLIAGAFYRITDYRCTTTQEKTRAMNNKFDIIVRALSENTLSEEAKADYHHEKVNAEIAEFLPSVLGDGYDLVEGSVTPYYSEYIDYAGGNANGLEQYHIHDIFIAYSYLENNNGVLVPVLFKTDPSGVGEDADPNYADPDWYDKFYYVGKAEIDGETYDKWRKIYDSEDSDLTWDSVGKIYIYTNVVTETKGYEEIDVIDGIQPSQANLSAWELRYCLDNDQNRFMWALPDGQQMIVNLRTGHSRGAPLVRQPSFDGYYEGSEYEKYYYAWGTQDGVDDGDSNNFVYSKNESIVDGEDVFRPNEIPWITKAEAVEGKGVIYYMKDEHCNECPYDFKNIQFARYKTATVTDDYGNELPYLINLESWYREEQGWEAMARYANDAYEAIKRIYHHSFLFIETECEREEYNSDLYHYLVDNGLIHFGDHIQLFANNGYEGGYMCCRFLDTHPNYYYWLYTFTNYDIETNDIYDSSIQGGAFYNKIGLNEVGQQIYELGNNVVVCYDVSNIAVGEYSQKNTFGSTANAKIGNQCFVNYLNNADFSSCGDNCSDNIIHDSSESNIGNSCYCNVIVDSYATSIRHACEANSMVASSGTYLGSGCNSNHLFWSSQCNLGDSCYSNILDNATNNVLANECGDNRINGGYQNVFGRYCYGNELYESSYTIMGEDCFNNILYECSYNEFGASCVGNDIDVDSNGNKFGRECEYNLLEQECVRNVFGDQCAQNYLESGCSENTFGDSCDQNYLCGDSNMNKFGNACIKNNFGYNCYGNIFGNQCVQNSLGDECSQNTFDKGGDNILNNLCAFNTFEGVCWYNELQEECNHNKFASDCYRNKLAKYCSHNTFGYNCEANELALDCRYNTFGKACRDNVFGELCYNNNFSDSCYENSLGGDCNRNEFSVMCGKNTLEGDCSDNSFGSYCTENVLRIGCGENKFYSECKKNTLGENSNRNKFGDDCEENTLGDACQINHIGHNCRKNTFGDGCYNNAFSDGCSQNNLDYDCCYNVLGSQCINNTFGNECARNIFNNSCVHNTLGAVCESNTFGVDCSNNAFSYTCCGNLVGNMCSNICIGNNCYGNTFGNQCRDIIFGTSTTETINLVHNSHFENGCRDIKLLNEEPDWTSNVSHYIENIKVCVGIKNKELEVSRDSAPVVFEAANTTHIILD